MVGTLNQKYRILKEYGTPLNAREI